MKKRNFSNAALLGARAGILHRPANAQIVFKTAAGPTLLNVSGLIGNSNRGALDTLLDRMIVKQTLGFRKAHAFDFAPLTALPAITIKPTLEYDNKSISVKGTLLAEVTKACAVKVGDKTACFLSADHGCAARISASVA